MTPAEFKTLRESLGLTTEWLAIHFKVAQRTIMRWEDAGTPPENVAGELLNIEEYAESLADDILEQLRAVDGAEIEYAVPRINDDAVSDQFPASFWRAVGARVRAGNPDVQLIWL